MDLLRSHTRRKYVLLLLTLGTGLMKFTQAQNSVCSQEFDIGRSCTGAGGCLGWCQAANLATLSSCVCPVTCTGNNNGAYCRQPGTCNLGKCDGGTCKEDTASTGKVPLSGQPCTQDCPSTTPATGKGFCRMFSAGTPDSLTGRCVCTVECTGTATDTQSCHLPTTVSECITGTCNDLGSCAETPLTGQTCSPSTPGSECLSVTGTCNFMGDCVETSLTLTGQPCRAAAGPCDLAASCDATGSCPANKFAPAGTLCRRAAKSCEADATCDGETAACRRIFKPNGDKCLFDELDEKFFWPHAEAAVASYGDRERTHHERDTYGEQWPVCYGRCSSGRCQLDKSKPGCCYSKGGRRGYAGSAEAAEHVETYGAANLVCWDGYGDGGY